RCRCEGVARRLHRAGRCRRLRHDDELLRRGRPEAIDERLRVFRDWIGRDRISSMPRIREIEEPGNDPILTDVFARERDVFGFVLNTTKIQAHRPGIMKAAKALAVAVEKSGLLTPQLLALVYLRVALINGCPF